MSRFFIIIGIAFVVLGVLWPFFHKIGLGKLPGDFSWKIGNIRLYFPLATSMLLSLVISLILWLVAR